MAIDSLPRAGTPTSVYKFYDERGVLIYVGITSRGVVRQREHNSGKEWWPFVASQRVEHFDSRQLAEDRERQLIVGYRPPFNRVHNVDHERLRTAYLAMPRQRPSERASLKQLLSTGKKRRIPLYILDVGESGSRLRHFLTDVEDQPIARCLALSAGTRIMSSVSGRRVGTVSSVSFDGLYVRFVAFLSVDLPASATAYAELRFAQLKHPVSIEVRKIAISDRAVTR